MADRGQGETAREFDREEDLGLDPVRVEALVSHLTVEEITAPRGWEQVIKIIEEAHEYLKVAKLEQAFNAAIFGGRRKAGQTLTGFLASKRAAFAELKKQGLDLLDSDAGQHLLGHLVLRQGGFTQDERQRIRVLTDGSTNFKLVEAEGLPGPPPESLVPARGQGDEGGPLLVSASLGPEGSQSADSEILEGGLQDEDNGPLREKIRGLVLHQVRLRLGAGQVSGKMEIRRGFGIRCRSSRRKTRAS